MKKVVIFAVVIATIGMLTPAVGFSQTAVKVEVAELGDGDKKELARSFKAFNANLAQLKSAMNSMQKFRGKDKELQGYVDGAQKANTAAREDLGKVIAIARKVEGSKVPRIAERMKSELDTIAALLAEIKSPKSLTSSIRNEFKQSLRVLGRDHKKLSAQSLLAE